jgi:prepilin-type N-terminal cleavage/methylation domain-containing protein
MRKYNSAFTLIEILISIMIIGILTGISLLSYTHSKSRARDTNRKEDLLNIQSAMEMYKSNNERNSYPPELNGILCDQTGAIADAGNTYLPKIPHDPSCNFRKYYYNALPDGCDGQNTICTDYFLGAGLESGTGSCSGMPANVCGSGGIACNYCLNSYGQIYP